ncbi:MAG: hypothetical protein E7Z77_02495 [Methanobrevibacter sp.]|uniref:phage distal tail protein n=1 Tax=Methanobrevibacter sp. TaxID=66852 RepID=UPI0025DD48BA|nr:hypothetical protein [Methanobrevibacter sp.]MBE6508264.1 hypothetical protein [Methanobrevibacter sp.]
MVNLRSKTYYPKTVTQSKGYDNWGPKLFRATTLGNIKTEANYAETSVIASATGTHKRPATVYASNFGISLEKGAEIKKIKVEYADQKMDYDKSNRHWACNLPAPTIKLENVSYSYTGVAPTFTMTNHEKTIEVKDPTSKFTSSSFGVTITYKDNTNYQIGYYRLKYIRVTVYYVLPEYSFAISKLDNKDTVDDITSISITANNINQLSHNPTITITLPSCVKYDSGSGPGTVGENNNVVVWIPAFKSSKSNTLVLNLTLVSAGTGNITVKEDVNGVTSILPISVVEKIPEVITHYEPVDSVSVVAYENTEIPISIDNDTYVNEYDIRLKSSDESLVFIYRGQEYNRLLVHHYDFDEEGKGNVTIRAYTPGNFIIEVYALVPSVEDSNVRIEEFLYSIAITVTHTKLSIPFCSYLEVTGEELDRLGDGYSYTVQSYLLMRTSRNEVNDWGKNFRMGVFNSPSDGFEGIDEDYLLENAIFSDPLTQVNTFESKTVEFTYDENCPLFIIFTGEYLEGYVEDSTIVYTSPAIIEGTGMPFEPTGIFPEPIKSIIISESSAEFGLEPLLKSNEIVCYRFPVGEDFGTNESMGIRGVELSINFEYADEVALTARLISNTGKDGERSVILSEDKFEKSNIVKLGGKFDLWGFDIKDMEDLEDWQLELSFHNIMRNDLSFLNFNNVQLTFYSISIEDELVKCSINGEDIRWYNVFIDELDLPSGLKTSVKYIDIDGSDMNDAYRQTIEKKEIKMKFIIRGCTIDETTENLRQFTRLITNKRDELNRPIPNKIEFSIYPDIYFEFILDSPLDNEVTAMEYEAEAKLIIPSGTSFSKTDNVTSNVGRNSGIAKVNPIITVFSCESGKPVEITDDVSKQKMVINIPEGAVDLMDIVEIDCINRKVTTIHNDVMLDLTGYVDFSSDWFIINEEFHYTSQNCFIQTVRFRERY